MTLCWHDVGTCDYCGPTYYAQKIYSDDRNNYDVYDLFDGHDDAHKLIPKMMAEITALRRRVEELEVKK